MPVNNIIPFELPLPQILPTIEGNVDYRDLRDQLLRINGLLVYSQLETQMIEADLRRWLARQKRVSAKAQQNRQFHARRALRCNIARLLLKEQYRGFAARLADSPLLQFFCGISEVDRVVVPSKSTLQRYFVWWTEAEVRQLIHQLLVQGAQDPERLELAQPLDLESAYLDSTCRVTPVSLRSAKKRHPCWISVARCGRESETVGERKLVSQPQPAAAMVC
jgi:hypothetical protein